MNTQTNSIESLLS